ncbi:MAG: SpoIIE family protein phosphatase [Opitutales bacterium]|nr:SpoIIE family protein phosphatase [Opitutales bacterium]
MNESDSVFSILAFCVAAALFVVWLYFVYRRSRWEYIRLESSLQHERYSHRLLVDVMRAIEKSLSDHNSAGVIIDKQTIYDSIMFAACRGTRAMSVCIFKISDDGKKLVPVAMTGLFPFLEGVPEAMRSASPSLRARLYFAGDEYSVESPLFKEALEQGHATLVQNFPVRPGRVHLGELPSVPKSVIIVPAFDSKGKTIGVIAIANPRHRGLFTEYEIKLADALAQQVSSAIEIRDIFEVRAEKHRLDSDLGVAAGVQQLLLPHRIPQAHSLDIAADYLPADRVGGDLYDIYDLGGDRVAAIVADVSGHGVSAALMMTICRTNFQRIANMCTGAADLLKQLARVMNKSFVRGKFLTIVCAVIDFQRGTMSIARGGHERPLLYTADVRSHRVVGCKSLEFLDSKGMPIGIVKPEDFNSTITEISRPYNKGDVLVLYTDGLTEARNAAGEEFGSDRLAAIVAREAHRPAKELNAYIINEAKQFAGKEKFFDDLTLVSIRSI